MDAGFEGLYCWEHLGCNLQAVGHTWSFWDSSNRLKPGINSMYGMQKGAPDLDQESEEDRHGYLGSIWECPSAVRAVLEVDLLKQVSC